MSRSLKHFVEFFFNTSYHNRFTIFSFLPSLSSFEIPFILDTERCIYLTCAIWLCYRLYLQGQIAWLLLISPLLVSLTTSKSFNIMKNNYRFYMKPHLKSLKRFTIRKRTRANEKMKWRRTRSFKWRRLLRLLSFFFLQEKRAQVLKNPTHSP